MKKHIVFLFMLLIVLTLIPMLGNADIAAKRGDLALFLKPSWKEGDDVAGYSYWAYDDRHEWLETVPGEKATKHGGRKFYQYEDYAGDGILYTVEPKATGLPSGYRHKGTVVVSEIGWSKRSPLTAQEVWEIWQQVPDNYKYSKRGVTQIQLLSDDMIGACYVLDNKYGLRDLRILIYGALLSGDAERDKSLVEEQIIRSLKGDGLCTKVR